eukprot:4431527-Amphidinium_carterae.1
MQKWDHVGELMRQLAYRQDCATVDLKMCHLHGVDQSLVCGSRPPPAHESGQLVTSAPAHIYYVHVSMKYICATLLAGCNAQGNEGALSLVCDMKLVANTKWVPFSKT